MAKKAAKKKTPVTTFDVVGDYSWTNIPKSSGLRDEAPQAFVWSYKMKESQLRSFVSGYMNITDKQSEDTDKFYDNLYKTSGKQTEYIFPYFEDNFRSYANNYADTFSQISQRGAQFLGQPLFETAGGLVEEALVGGASLASGLQSEMVKTLTQKAANATATGAEKLGINQGAELLTGRKGYEFKIPAPGNPADFPGTYAETPKFFQYANTDAAVEINFMLANTITERDIEMNQKLIENIIEESRPTRHNSIELSFPNIYEVTIPGLRHIRWAALANAAFNLVGARRKVDGRIVPEAYAISLTFQSLTLEPSNFLKKADMS